MHEIITVLQKRVLCDNVRCAECKYKIELKIESYKKKYEQNFIF